MTGEYETFIAMVRDTNTGSKEITIDSKLCEFLGLSPGDNVKVMIKKICKED